jgi:serine/threonine protein kinase
VFILTARFVLAPLVITVFLIHKFITTRKMIDNKEEVVQYQLSMLPKRYSFTDIISMTNHLKDQLGQGGFGSVYKGELPGGHIIAIKILDNSMFSGEQLLNEISTISRICHVNVLPVEGFCSEGSNLALVYEYMPNGSLDKHIFSKKGKGMSFSWEKLHEIALGTARGIEYLHGGCGVCILHFDIKPHNILLDHNFIPKISDFGLAKLCLKEDDFVSISTTRGTIGYMAPELVSKNFDAVSCKSDVYSFGMLLLEMVAGRKNFDAKANCSSKVYFPLWVYDHLNEGGELELGNVTNVEAVIARKLCIIGLWCIQMKPSDRPTLNKVVELLEGTRNDLQMPPRPFFSTTPYMSLGELHSDSSTELLISESMEKN